MHLAPAFRDAQPSLEQTPRLAGQLDTTVAHLDKLAEDARLVPGVERLTDTATILRDPLHFVTPAQTT